MAGIDHIPEEKPLLFVGNHTLLGVLDVGFLWAELYQRRGMLLRGLGDHVHFQVPGWSRVVRACGAVDGTPDNCRALFASGQHVLVFPGGGREVSKRKGERYRVIWKERLGFARLAIEQGVTVVPFSAVGVEHALDVVLDADEIFASPLGGLLRALKIRPDVLLPIVRGIGPTPVPRPERLYFRFGEAIETRAYGGVVTDEAARAVRDRARAAVEGGIAQMLERREQYPERGVVARVRALVRSGAGRK